MQLHISFDYSAGSTDNLEAIPIQWHALDYLASSIVVLEGECWCDAGKGPCLCRITAEFEVMQKFLAHHRVDTPIHGPPSSKVFLVIGLPGANECMQCGVCNVQNV